MVDETPQEAIQRLVAQRDELARHLYNILHKLHVVYGSTSGPHGGPGGQAMTAWCHVNDPASDLHMTLRDDADAALRALPDEVLLKIIPEDRL